MSDLETLRTRLEAIEEVPVDDRVAVFEEVNAAVAAHLAELDEL